MINVTSKDVVSNQILPPGWYFVKVTKVTQSAAKSDQSANYTFDLEVIQSKSGDTSAAGARLKGFLINEKGLFASGIAFLVACGFPKEEMEKLKKKETTSVPVDENLCVDKTIQALVSTTEYQNRKSNEAVDFLAV